MAFTKARNVVLDAVARQAFPGAAVEVGSARQVRWREAFGRLTYDQDAPATTPETIFDLASLTKVIATTTAAEIAIVGVGATGSCTAEQLVRLGVRNLIIIDHDYFEPSNASNRQARL